MRFDRLCPPGATDHHREFLPLRRAELTKRMNAFIDEKAGL